MYDFFVSNLEQGARFGAGGLGTVVDPLVLRVGQLFLSGKSKDQQVAQSQWDAIENNLGALVSFFDLVVLRDQFPAFNYYDTYDNAFGTYEAGYGTGLELPSTEAVLNSGDKTLVHVDMEHELYRRVKAAALAQLRTRVVEGPLVSPQARSETLAALHAVRYQWEPSLEDLEGAIPDPADRQVARFLLGQLVFTGYAQTVGTPHVLAPTASRLLASAGIRSARATPQCRGRDL